MPIPAQFQNMVESLVFMTDKRRVNWLISEVQPHIVYFIRGPNTIQIEWRQFPECPATITMRILNSDGQLVDAFEVLENGEGWADMHELHNEARRKAMKADDVIAAITGDLHKKLKDGGHVGD